MTTKYAKNLFKNYNYRFEFAHNILPLATEVLILEEKINV